MDTKPKEENNMIPPIYDCSRIQREVSRLQAAQELFSKAIQAAKKACEEGYLELKRPLTPVEKEEKEIWKEGGLDL